MSQEMLFQIDYLSIPGSPTPSKHDFLYQ